MGTRTVVNAGLMRGVIGKIREFPELHNQVEYFTHTECGTAACFAGWTCLLSGHQPLDGLKLPGVFVVSFNGYADKAFDVARDELGITTDQALTLFDPGNTRQMLELMVEDLIQTGELKEYDDYIH